MKQLVQIHVGIVALNDFGRRLQGAYYLLNASQLLGLHFGNLVQQDDVAKLYLTDDEVLNVFLVQPLASQAIATGKLTLQTQGIDHADQAIQPADAMLGIGFAQPGNGAEGLCYGLGLADAAGLDDNIVETLGTHQLVDLLNEVGLQGTTDASVLQGHEAIVLLRHHATLLYEVGVNVHLAYVVHDDGEAYASLISQYTVHQRCLATTQVAREQQYGNFFLFHDV